MAGGRPLKFNSVSELQEKINSYFETTPKDEWTWTGLSLYLDTDKETIAMYRDGIGERAEFSEPLKRAMLQVENGYEIDLKKQGRTGTIFALKNFNWKDKSEVDQNVKSDISLNMRDLSNEELEKLITPIK